MRTIPIFTGTHLDTTSPADFLTPHRLGFRTSNGISVDDKLEKAGNHFARDSSDLNSSEKDDWASFSRPSNKTTYCAARIKNGSVEAEAGKDSSGLYEFHRPLPTQLRAMVGEMPRDWDTMIDALENVPQLMRLGHGNGGLAAAGFASKMSSNPLNGLASVFGSISIDGSTGVGFGGAALSPTAPTLTAQQPQEDPLDSFVVVLDLLYSGCFLSIILFAADVVMVGHNECHSTNDSKPGSENR
ncbi:hypothetical protein K438DRAFT_1996643 [Mycena galopus ATCC 62051]|nr:hypothetical protein K438DRAFT_1996643 [Mycena galopus ATCC 62051]